jgi:hypothetical protein
MEFGLVETVKCPNPRYPKVNMSFSKIVSTNDIELVLEVLNI